MTKLRDLLAKATGGEWILRTDYSGCPYISGKHKAMIADINMGFVSAKEANANAALIVALHNCADELLKVVEAAEHYIGHSVCHCSDKSHESLNDYGWNEINCSCSEVLLRAALRALRQKEGR